MKEKQPPRIARRRVDYTYWVHIDGLEYRVVHCVFPNNDFGERWTVHGGGPMRDHYCDENGRTFKRVVATLKQLLESNT
jgi:hypothetical protein